MHPDLKLSPGIHATPHRFLWLPEHRAAILSDLHLGVRESLAAQGLHVPDAASAPLLQSWQKLLERRPARIIIAGDLFDSPRPQAAAIALVETLFAALPADCHLTLTPGNHDPLFPADFIKHLFDTAPSITLGEITISHGHTRLAEIPAIWVVGHQHPAVTLSTRMHSAKMPCFATCKTIDTKTLLLLPAFSRAPLGSNLLTGRNWLLPLPRPNEQNIQIAGLIEPTPPRDPQVLDFGPLSLLATNH